ncbi:MAG TPA: hypothetical protein VKA60_12205 [Blastocatellia bacterium]|nr:hypothetical protein [Blastocatellia bacterium]
MKISYWSKSTSLSLIPLVFALAITRDSSLQIKAQDIEPSPPGADITILGPTRNSHLGGSGSATDLNDLNHSQALACGDFNGDGIPDLAIGAPDAMLIVGATQRTAAGAAYIIFGRQDLPAVIDTAGGRAGGVDVTILGTTDGDHFGFALAAGDINGDGITDLIVGAPGAGAPNRSGSGAIYVFLGGRSFAGNAAIDLAQGGSADLTIYGAGERFGAAIATGDAGGPTANTPLTDLLIGAPGGPDSSGAAYLIYGRASLGSQTRVLDMSTGGADFTLRGDVGQHLGVSLAIGDFNGDHAGDLFVGAPRASRPDRNDLGGVSLAPASYTGAVFAVLGPFPQGGALDVTNAAAVISFYGGGPGHQFGTALAADDLTGDGIADLVVGAPNVDGRFPDPVDGSPYSLNGYAGAAYVFAGRGGMTQRRFDAAASEYLTVYIGLGHNWVGFAVGTGSYNVPGNADTVPDLLIGRPSGVRDALSNLGGNGAVNVVFGGRTLASVRLRPRSPFNPAPEPEEVAVGNPPFQTNTDFGFAVAAGDLNGDTSGDLVTAMPFATASGRQQAGIVEVRFGTVKPAGSGGGGGGSPVTVRLLSPGSGDHFQASQQVVISWDAAGRDQVRGFDVLLSTDGGVTFSTSIATNLSPDQSSLVWVVPTFCADSAQLQVVANLLSGGKVVSTSVGSFTIAQRGPGVDLSRSSIAADSLLLTATAGEAFPDGVVVEVSKDEAGTSYVSFIRPAKLKAGGRKLKTRGTLDGMDLDQFFPNDARRVLRLVALPCNVTTMGVRRQGNQLLTVTTAQDH